MKLSEGNDMSKMKDLVCVDTIPAEDRCSWIACDLLATRTWARKGYCYSCYREIMDSKD
jgi:hypothetical protein